MISVRQERSYGAVIFDADGQVLIEQMALGHVSIPKGHVEAGETPEQTARREIREETGLEVTLDMSFSRDVSYAPYPGVNKLVTFFLAFYRSGILTPQPAEVRSLSWVAPEKAYASLTYESDRQVVKDAVSYLKSLKAG